MEDPNDRLDVVGLESTGNDEAVHGGFVARAPQRTNADVTRRHLDRPSNCPERSERPGERTKARSNQDHRSSVPGRGPAWCHAKDERDIGSVSGDA
jgi:hypothetical protein